MSVNTDALAIKVGTALYEALESKKDQIIDSAGGIIARQGTKLAFPVLLGQTEHLAEVAIAALRKEFGDLSLNDLLDWLGKN